MWSPVARVYLVTFAIGLVSSGFGLVTPLESVLTSFGLAALFATFKAELLLEERPEPPERLDVWIN